MDRASHGQLENEFGSKKPEDAIEKILKEGKVEQTKMGQKYGSTNDAKFGSLYVPLLEPLPVFLPCFCDRSG